MPTALGLVLSPQTQPFPPGPGSYAFPCLQPPAPSCEPCDFTAPGVPKAVCPSQQSTLPSMSSAGRPCVPPAHPTFLGQLANCAGDHWTPLPCCPAPLSSAYTFPGPVWTLAPATVPTLGFCCQGRLTQVPAATYCPRALGITGQGPQCPASLPTVPWGPASISVFPGGAEGASLAPSERDSCHSLTESRLGSVTVSSRRHTCDLSTGTLTCEHGWRLGAVGLAHKVADVSRGVARRPQTLDMQGPHLRETAGRQVIPVCRDPHTPPGPPTQQELLAPSGRMGLVLTEGQSPPVP